MPSVRRLVGGVAGAGRVTVTQKNAPAWAMEEFDNDTDNCGDDVEPGIGNDKNHREPDKSGR